MFTNLSLQTLIASSFRRFAPSPLLFRADVEPLAPSAVSEPVAAPASLVLSRIVTGGRLLPSAPSTWWATPTFTQDRGTFLATATVSSRRSLDAYREARMQEKRRRGRRIIKRGR